MEKLLPLLCLIFLSMHLSAQLVDIPDDNFLEALIFNGVDENNDGQIQVSEAEVITELTMINYNIASLEGIEAFSALEILDCSSNELTSIDLLVANKSLREMIASFNNLTSFDISTNNQGGLPNLMFGNVTENSIFSIDISGLENLEIMDIGGNPELISVNAENCSSLQKLESSHSMIETINLKGCSSLEFLDLVDNRLTEIDLSDLVNLQEVLIESNDIMELDISGLEKLESIGAGDLISLHTLNAEGCIALRSIFMFSAPLQNLNVRGCIALEDLVIHSGNLSGVLDLSNLVSLILLDIASSNEITELNLENCSSLDRFDLLDPTQLERINLSGCDALSEIMLLGTQLTSLDLTGLSNLMFVIVDSGLLTEIDLTGCSGLQDLTVSNNQLSVLDVSECVNLFHLDCYNNNLIQLFIKNGSNELVLLGENPNLEFICADADELEVVQEEVDALNLTDVIINSFCPYTFSSQPYRIIGQNIFDFDMSGCDMNEGNVPQVKFEISDGTNTGDIISTLSGNYTINLPEGDYTITPKFDNSSLFNISPESISFSFSGTETTVEQDFCITPIGTQDDVEITLIPVDEARPGFETRYRIKYTNIGNTVQSGSIMMTYLEELMDFVSSSEVIVSAGDGTLLWTYENLTPFESKSIDIIMELNTPVEDPPLNGDDVLSFIVRITTDNGQDINLQNNQFIYRQLVVNSFDPNDKTCLDGTRISPDEVGDFVSYMIRFENTGTADAVNIVVRDSIDPAVFDVSTLVIIDASHSMRTEITGDIVEFIFKDIYLPFEDATNDGFIVFKLKTWPSLNIGDELNNLAEIYFDFNAPIITNTTSTIVTETTASEDPLLSDKAISVYPNPTNNQITISSPYKIKEISLIEIDGRVVKTKDLDSYTEDVSMSVQEIPSGLYLIRILAEEGVLYKRITIFD